MPFQKGKPRAIGAGRKKDTLNKSTAELKESILIAFHQAGGADYLAGLASTHPHVFCQLLSKIIPAEVKAEITGKDGGAILTEITIEHHGLGKNPAALESAIGRDSRHEIGIEISSGAIAGVEVNGAVPSGPGGHAIR